MWILNVFTLEIKMEDNEENGSVYGSLLFPKRKVLYKQ